ncbi:MAG: hypothetical protein LBL52_02670 [Rickettsiales bacterium]|jgi:hypothetical protein|nr:hypothetical protein [Rickettsiales bacterium]
MPNEGDLMYLLLFLLTPALAKANPACVVCTVALASFLEVSRILGVPDVVVGVWTGALLLMTFYFMLKFMERVKWTFRGYRLLSAVMTVSIIPVLYKYVPWMGSNYFGIDSFLASMAAGALTFEGSQRIYQVMKAKNGGHAHFPFEKVVMAVAALLIVSVVFYYLP